MPTVGDINLFRRLIGDFTDETVDDLAVEEYLNDAAEEYSSMADDLTSTAVFDAIPTMHKIAVIYTAAISWWWNKASTLTDKHTTTIGAASQNIGETFERCMRMIEMLQTRLQGILADPGLNSITFANSSRFSKRTLTRLGGVKEEDTLE